MSTRDLSSAEIEMDLEVLYARYPEVSAFADLMYEQLYANRGKGDQAVWRAANPKDLVYDIAWHQIKLMAALKDGNADAIREHAADVANLAMMALDAWGGLHGE